MLTTQKLPCTKLSSINIDLDTLGCDLYGQVNNTSASQEIRRITFLKIIPRLIEIFDEFNLKATFFVIGVDCKDSASQKVIKILSTNGHEIANHTMNHQKQFAYLERSKQRLEILESQKIIEDVIGQPVKGFRAPGYTITKTTIDLLIELEYSYDSSLNTSLLYTLCKHAFRTFLLHSDNKKYISIQSNRFLLAPPHPYFPDDNEPWKPNSSWRDGALLEIPISVIPWVSYPFVNAFLMRRCFTFLKTGYCLLAKNSPVINYELHDCEFLETSDFEAVRGKDNKSYGYFASRYLNIDIKNRLSFLHKTIELFKEGTLLTTLIKITRLYNDANRPPQ